MPLVSKSFSDIITFSRGSNATYFDSAGVLKYAPNNLLTYSEAFDDASWLATRLNTTGTPAWVDVAVAPDGATTADKLIPNTDNNTHTISKSPTLTANTAYAWSVFAKAAEYENIRIRFGKSGSPFTRIGVIVNLLTGTVTNSDVGTPTSVTQRSAVPVGNGWYKITVAGIFDTTSTDGFVSMEAVNNAGATTFAGNGTDGVLIWGAQLNIGDLQPYYPTQATAYYGPRLDYNPSTLAAQGLLIEEQRTNLLTYSEAFDTTPDWAVSNSSITANAVSSPDGATTADKLVEAATTGGHYVSQTFSAKTGAHTLTVFVKAAERTHALLLVAGGTTQRAVGFNLTTGATYAESIGGVSPPDITATMVDVGNGWWRCQMPWTADGQTSARIYTDSGTGNGSTTGDGTSGIYIWGAQLEAGTFPTSYIPTTTTALTRAADVANVNTLSPWYNASEGTLFVEAFGASGASTYLAALFTDGATEIAGIRNFSNSARFVAQGTASGSVGAITSTAAYKAAFAFSSSSQAMSANGGAVVTGSTAITSTPTIFRLGSGATGTVFITAPIRRITYYPRRLSNAELVAITSA